MDCIIYRGSSADAELDREEVWADDLWRLTVSLVSETPGFAYLEPRRHIADITALDGPEVQSIGTVLSRCSRVLKEAAGAEIVYLYVFGDGVRHLHVHLAPHSAGDALNDQIIKGDIVEEKLDSGITRFSSALDPALPRPQLEALARRVRDALR